MIVIPKTLWTGTREDLEIEIAEYVRAMDEHRKTVGQPAPLAAAEWIEKLARSGAEWSLEPDPIPAWAVTTRGVGEPVLYRETFVGELLAEGELLELSNPAGKILAADGALRLPTNDEALARAKAVQWEVIKRARDEALNGSLLCEFNGSTWQAREADRARLAGAVAMLEDPKLPALLPTGITVPATLPWRDESNTVRQLSPDEGRVLVAMMFLAQQAVWVKSWNAEEQINAARTVAAVQAVIW